MEQKGHHLILGTLTDAITGERLEDTHDERYRQKMARLLLEEKGFRKNDILPRVALEVKAGEKRARITIDFQVRLDGRIVMLIKYGPGSLVTRHRPGLAAGRLVAGYQVPVIVVTNGEDADVLDGITGRVTGSGLAAIPDRETLHRRLAGFDFRAVSSERAVLESRIVYAYEVDGSCPCDDTVCRL